MQDFVISLRICLQHLRAGGGGEYIADYCCGYYKTTGISQQFSPPNSPERKSLSERDRRLIMDVAWCMLNGAALPSFFGGKYGHRRVSTQPPSKQDHRWRYAILKDVRQTRQRVLSVDCWDPSVWRPSNTSCATFAADPVSTSP